MRLLITFAVLLVASWGASYWNYLRAERAISIGHELAGIAELQQSALEAGGQVSRIIEAGAAQCASVGQQPAAICLRFSGAKVVEARGECTRSPRPSRADRDAPDQP